MQTKNKRFLLELVIILFWASEYCHAPYFTPYLDSLHLTSTLTGLIVACYGMTQMIARIPLGIATDITGTYRVVIVSGLVFTTVSSLGLYLTQNVWLIFLCRVLAGLASSTWIAMTVVYVLYFPKKQSIVATARLNALNNTGKLLAFFVGGVVAVKLGYQTTLFASFLVGLIGLLLSFFIEKVEIHRVPLNGKKLVNTLFRHSVIIPALFMAVQQMMIHATVFSFTSSIVKQSIADNVALSLLSIVFTLVQIPAVKVISSPKAMKVPQNYVIAAGFFLLSGYSIVLAIGQNLAAFLIGQSIAAFGSALLNAFLLSECLRDVQDGERSTVVGVYQAVYGIGMTIGPMWMGWLLEHIGRVVACSVFSSFAAFTGLLALIIIKGSRK